MKSENNYKLKISRTEICDLMLACTGIVIDARTEQRDPNTDSTRQKVLAATVEKWQSLHDKLKAQLDEQDA